MGSISANGVSTQNVHWSPLGNEGPWTNTDGALTSYDNSYAYTSSANTDLLVLTFNGLTIPSTAQVTGIQIFALMYNQPDLGVVLGVCYGPSVAEVTNYGRATSVQGNYLGFSFGGSSDLMGASAATARTIFTSTFYVGFYSRGGSPSYSSASVHPDLINIIVFYTSTLGTLSVAGTATASVTLTTPTVPLALSTIIGTATATVSFLTPLNLSVPAGVATASADLGGTPGIAVVPAQVNGVATATASLAGTPLIKDFSAWYYDRASVPVYTEHLSYFG